MDEPDTFHAGQIETLRRLAGTTLATVQHRLEVSVHIRSLTPSWRICAAPTDESK